MSENGEAPIAGAETVAAPAVPSVPSDEARDERLLVLMRGMYPGWRFTRRVDRHGHTWWWVLRVSPLNAAQRQAGLIGWFARPTLLQVAAELSDQHAIAHHRRL